MFTHLSSTHWSLGLFSGLEISVRLHHSCLEFRVQGFWFGVWGYAIILVAPFGIVAFPWLTEFHTQNTTQHLCMLSGDAMLFLYHMFFIIIMALCLVF